MSHSQRPSATLEWRESAESSRRTTRDRDVRELGRVFFFIRLKILNISTEVLLKQKIPSQV